MFLGATIPLRRRLFVIISINLCSKTSREPSAHTNNPSKDDNQGQNQQRNLHTRSHRHTDRKIHLILAGNSDGSSMLRRVADNRQKDQANKGLANVSSLCQGVDRVDLVYPSQLLRQLNRQIQNHSP